MRFAGFDPGGDKAFGWAVIEATQRSLHFIAGGVVTGAPVALSQSLALLQNAPVAIGIDAPLFWVPAGDRRADLQIRRLVCGAGGKSGTVSHVNSLRGACLVQGVLIARLAHKQWPTAQITEAHPKALLRISESARTFASTPELQELDDHVRDAALAAYAAHAFVARSPGWHNLAEQERDLFFPGGAEVAYWFPKQRA